MLLSEMPKQYQLFYEVSKYFFSDPYLKCAVLVSKTPYLACLVACHGARVKITKPYPPGTCVLLPDEQEPNFQEYFHAVIDGMSLFDGEPFYYFRDRKKIKIQKKKINTQEIDPGCRAKPCTYIEENGIIFPEREEDGWLGKHNIRKDLLNGELDSIYPAVIGVASKMDYWQKIPLGIKSNPVLDMEKILNLRKSSRNLSNLNVYSYRNPSRRKRKNQIWVNAVPESLDDNKYLIVLSPSHSNFEDMKLHVNDLYANHHLKPISSNEVSQNLIELGALNNTSAIISVMSE